ncbi:hypothetical protein [Deinococcus peraridilitoris]|uniref:Uncharacterized protein n=1 Tax=Deinococcus peraridilitoris (strain DSM 19664 / LMG 22246 / CIP 109416 / KR-200) TaxID=937777 RepID=L0A6D1_DEIPD|nr:hypothetical protein [Deinococcus peraridilitoris]AFZ68727.1 hypothetical protein Deipe_3286 [Deinococcus peraridilitoris DSM 19664]
MTQTPAVRFSCAWVPATLDRVRVSSPYGTFEVDLQLVRQVLGRPALQALYLQGRYNVEKPELTLRAILDQLGIELAPQTIAPRTASTCEAQSASGLQALDDPGAPRASETHLKIRPVH